MNYEASQALRIVLFEALNDKFDRWEFLDVPRVNEDPFFIWNVRAEFTMFESPNPVMSNNIVYTGTKLEMEFFNQESDIG